MNLEKILDLNEITFSDGDFKDIRDVVNSIQEGKSIDEEQWMSFKSNDNDICVYYNLNAYGYVERQRGDYFTESIEETIIDNFEITIEKILIDEAEVELNNSIIDVFKKHIDRIVNI